MLGSAPAGVATPPTTTLTASAVPTTATKSIPVASSVSLSAPVKVAYKGTATFKGSVKLTKSKKPISKATVTIQRKSGTKWVKVAAVVTDKSGNYKYSAKGLTQSATYRVTVSKTAKYKASTSSAIKVTVGQAPPAPSTISLSAPSTVAQKGTAALKGDVKISTTGAAISNASVSIQRQTSAKWVDVATVTTDKKGAFSFNARGLTRDLTYRATVKKTAKYKASTSTSKKVSVKQIVTLTSSGAKTFTSGSAIKITGTVTPGLYSKQVSLQKSVNGSWATLKNMTVSSTGTFTASIPVYGAGADQKLRVIGANAPARTWSVNIYAWYNLSTMEPLAKSKNFGNKGSVQLRGKFYPNSLNFYWSAASFGGWNEGNVSYNLGFKCTRFESQVGVDDRSPGALAAWDYTLSRDGVETSTGFVGLGKDQQMTADLTSVLRIELSAVRKEAPGWDYLPYKADAAWGSPRVLCLGAP